MIDEHALGELAARRSAAYSSLLNSGGMVIEWLIERRVAAMPWWPLLASASVGVALLLVVAAARRMPELRVGSAAFLLNAAAVIFALWMSHPHFAASGRPWRPFEANKLGAMTVALLAPDRWTGLATIIAYAGSALVQYHLFPDNVRQQLALEEPTATVAYGSFAVFLLAYRLRGQTLARAVVRAQAEAVVLQRLARASLAFRDLANTPLQTLELCMAILRSRGDGLEPVLARMQRALGRLQALRHTLSPYDAPVSGGGEGLSLDSIAAIRAAGGKKPRRS